MPADPSRRPLVAWLAAVLAAGVAVLLRWLMDPYLGDALPLVTLFGAVTFAVWMGGIGPAVLCALLGYVACAWLFMPPRDAMPVWDNLTVFSFVAYFFTCAVIIALGQAMRVARAQVLADGELKKLAEQEKAHQLQSARLLAAIVESSDDAIISKSLDGVIQSWNQAAERLFGHPASFATGRHISLVIPPDRLPEEDNIIASLKAGRRIEHFETLRLHRDGHQFPVSLTISPIYNDAGKVIGASKIARDITARRHVEAERVKFVTLVQSSTDFIGMADMKGMPFFVNQAGLAIVGLDNLEQAAATPLGEFFFPEDRARILDEFIPAVIRDGHCEIDIRFRQFKTGQAIWMAYKVVLIKDEAGRPIALATVSQDITERRRLNDHLRQLANELSAADSRKNEFLATLAHELRNPLAPMSNMLEVLRVKDSDPEARRRARDTMGRQLRQLVRLVDDLLDLNRITHNRLELRLSEIELGSIMTQAIESSAPLTRASRQILHVELPDDPIYLLADPARLAQVFGNLLNNAARYSPPGSSIVIAARREGGDVVVSVRDNGIGIPADKLNDIFEMFTQLDPGHARAQGGLGIGLTLARRLVNMHGGGIEARSAGAGQGSEFIVRLPTIARAPVAAPAPLQAPVRPRRVLVVDDNEDAAVSLAMLLDMSGNETHLAHDGEQALAAAEKYRPDVMLLDIGMPKLSGLEVCRRMRQTTWGRKVKVYALTGWGQEQDRRKSEEAGFDGHLVKPVDPATLTKLMESA